MIGVLYSLAYAALLSTAAIFGFFYAWVCSTMWGLDAVDPEVAIAAMQAMNASVRNVVFALAFFGTLILLFLTAFAAAATSRKLAAFVFAGAGLIYAVGGFAVTASFNVPLNEALAMVQLPLEPEVARQTWTQYSEPWKFWNILRTVACGVALLFTGYGLTRLSS